MDKSSQGNLLTPWLPFAHIILQIMGLIVLVIAAFTFAVVAGLIATGVSLILVGVYVDYVQGRTP